MWNLGPELSARVIDQAKKAEQSFESTVIQCGIIGASGTGKSSLINALIGKDVAEVGVKETTGVSGVIHPHDFHGIVLMDLPGVGTQRFQSDHYFSDLAQLKVHGGKGSVAPEAFDFFILVLANRILEEDLKLYHLITEKFRKPCFLVRSKFDMDADNNYRTKRKTDRETHAEILQDIWKNFPSEKMNPVFVVSSADPLRGDFEELRRAILRFLPKDKAEKFIAFSNAYSQSALKKKRKVSEKLARRTALLSAVNALNPVPGLDIAADMSLLLKLSKDLLEIYGLSSEQVDFTTRMHFENEAWSVALKRRLSLGVRSYLTKDGITAVLRLLAPKIEAKQFAKLIPLAGQSIAVILGYHLTYSYGKTVMNEFEKLALSNLSSSRKN